MVTVIKPLLARSPSSSSILTACVSFDRSCLRHGLQVLPVQILQHGNGAVLQPHHCSAGEVAYQQRLPAGGRGRDPFRSFRRHSGHGCNSAGTGIGVHLCGGWSRLHKLPKVSWSQKCDRMLKDASWR